MYAKVSELKLENGTGYCIVDGQKLWTDDNFETARMGSSAREAGLAAPEALRKQCREMVAAEGCCVGWG